MACAICIPLSLYHNHDTPSTLVVRQLGRLGQWIQLDIDSCLMFGEKGSSPSPTLILLTQWTELPRASSKVPQSLWELLRFGVGHAKSLAICDCDFWRAKVCKMFVHSELSFWELEDYSIAGFFFRICLSIGWPFFLAFESWRPQRKFF